MRRVRSGELPFGHYGAALSPVYHYDRRIGNHLYGRGADAQPRDVRLANWLAWNRNCKEYKFQDVRYEPHKEKAFGMLAQAITIENKALQHTVLHKA